MNEQTMNQPITAGDLSALSSALNAPGVTQSQAQQTYLKMLVQMQGAPLGVAPTANQIFTALASGAQSKADEALYEALAFETMVGGSVTALIVQAAGFIKIFEWVESAASWFKTNATAVGTLLADLGTGNFSAAWTQAMQLLGISSAQKTGDVSYDTASVAKQGLMLLMSSEAPLLATATTYLSSKGKVNLGGSGSQSASGSAASGSVGGSRSGAGTSASEAKGDRKKKDRYRSNKGRKADSLGISPRMKLMSPE
jgi:hypothetical protein